MKLIIDVSEDDLRLCPEYIQGDIVLSRIVNAVKNGTPIPDNATVCDIEQIRDEIQKVINAERDFTSENARAQAIALNWCLDIIDKYMKGE